ncbi:MAG: fluoride efflux transporter FluC [Micrococcales bacterium]
MKLTFRVALLAFAGGALGTFFRWWLGYAINDSLWAIATVNLLGAYAIGFFNGHSWFNTDARRALYSVGFCGGFTTLSALMANVTSPMTAVFVTLEFVAGIAVYLAGRNSGHASSIRGDEEANRA